MNKHRLNEIITEKGVTRKELASLMMCSQGSASNKLLGRQPVTVEDARSLAYGLNLTTREIMECFFEEGGAPDAII